MNGVFLTLPCLLPPYRKGVVQNTLQMAFPILFNWQHLNTESMQADCKQKSHLHPDMNLIAVFLALRVDQNLVDMHILNTVDMHIHDQDRLGSFSWCTEVILTGQFFGLFFQEQQEYFSHSSANANPVYLSALVKG